MRQGKSLLIIRVYVDDIIIGATNKTLCNEFARLMENAFAMNMMVELIKFLPWLKVKQTKDDTTKVH